MAIYSGGTAVALLKTETDRDLGAFPADENNLALSIAVTRTNPRADLKIVLEQGVERVSRNLSIVVFPQTTRAAFNPEQFSTIGVKLARRAGVPIIPLALRTDAWENGTIAKDFGKIVPSRKVFFAFGEPLIVEGKGGNEQNQIIDFIESNLAAWERAEI